MRIHWILGFLLSTLLAVPAWAQDSATDADETATTVSEGMDAGDGAQDTPKAKPASAKRMGAGFPKNSRRVPAGYMVGGTPTLESVDVMKNAGIKLIFSLSYNTNNIKQLHDKIVASGIEHLNVRMGRSFAKLPRFLSTVKKYKPSEVYIHCEHGGDRSGSMLAFMLVHFQGWDIAEALLAVLNNSTSDLNGLKIVFKEEGIPWTQEQVDNYLSIYSTGTGGLKARNDDYRKLIRTTVAAMREAAE